MHVCIFAEQKNHVKESFSEVISCKPQFWVLCKHLNYVWMKIKIHDSLYKLSLFQTVPKLGKEEGITVKRWSPVWYGGTAAKKYNKDNVVLEYITPFVY